MSICATVGRPIVTSIDVCIHDGFVVFDRPLCSQSYLFHILKALEPGWSKRGQTGSQMNLNTELIRTTHVPVPSAEAEQEAIAEALSDADALIESLEQLIAKKRLIKQGVMQELLTGKRRLPGFDGEWRACSLGRLGKWLSGGTPNKKTEHYWDGAIPWVSPKDMKRSRIHDAIDHVSEAALENGTRLLPAGSLMVVVRGMILAHSAPVALCERPVAFNQDIKALVPKSGINSHFLLWWLVSAEHTLLSKTATSTHGTMRIPAGDLFSIVVRVPPHTEQVQIAQVITDLEDEEHTLSAQLSMAEQLKQGMMQQLLTGKIRLV